MRDSNYQALKLSSHLVSAELDRPDTLRDKLAETSVFASKVPTEQLWEEIHGEDIVGLGH